MGLEGIDVSQKIANFRDIKPLSPTMLYIESLPMAMLGGSNKNNPCFKSNSILQSGAVTETCNQLQLLLQVISIHMKVRKTTLLQSN